MADSDSLFALTGQRYQKISESVNPIFTLYLRCWCFLKLYFEYCDILEHVEGLKFTYSVNIHVNFGYIVKKRAPRNVHPFSQSS